MAEYVPVLGIAIVLFALSEILKRTVLKNNDELKSVIPYFCAIVGAVAAAGLYAVDPSIISGANNILDAIVSGAISGLLATGAHQLYKQFYKLIAVGKSTKEDIDKEVSEMTADEKKEYLTGIATDMVTDVLNKVNGVEEESTDSESENDSDIVTEIPNTNTESTEVPNDTKPY